MRKDVNLKELVKRVKQKYGSDLSTPKGFLCLSMEINDKLGKCLSVSTIKRIFGYVGYNNIPSLRTLDILSNYIGYCDYAEFCDGNSERIDAALFICGLHIEIGDIVEVLFGDSNNTLQLQYKGNFTFMFLQ